MFNERSQDLPIIERKLLAQELKLPAGIRKHIRNLKEEGRFEEAVRFRRESITRKIVPKKLLENMTNSTLRELIISNSPEIQALSALKLTWLLNVSGLISDSEREADLYQIHQSWPEQSELLKQKDIPIVFEVSKLATKADNS
jgi:hypothetical protein